jgi:hypothetical protein
MQPKQQQLTHSSNRPPSGSPAPAAKPTAAVALQSIAGLGSVNNADRLREVLEVARSAGHVIGPVAAVSSLSNGYGASVTAVLLDSAVNANGNGTDCYFSKAFMRPGEVGISRIGLAKISQAVGVVWRPHPFTRRVDDGSKEFYVEYHVEGDYRVHDGSLQMVSGTAHVDYSDGSPDIGGWTPDAWAMLVDTNRTLKKDDQVWAIGGWSEKRVLMARQKVLERAETLAKNRAIRDLGIRQVYTVEELRKPFLCVRFAYAFDMTDETVKRMVTQAHLQASGLLGFSSDASVAPQPAGVPAVAVVALPPMDPPATERPVAGQVVEAAPTPASPAAPAAAPVDVPLFEDPAAAAAAEESVLYRVLAAGRRDDQLLVKLDGIEVACRTENEEIVRAAIVARDRGVGVYVEKRRGEDGVLWLDELVVTAHPAPAVQS